MGEVAGQGWVEQAEAVAFPWPVGKAEQGGQRDGEVSRGRKRRAGSRRLARGRAVAAVPVWVITGPDAAAACA